MPVNSGITGQSPRHLRLVLGALFVAVSINLLYPGEVFFPSRYLFVLVSLLACAVVLYQGHKGGISVDLLRHLALAFLPLAVLLPSLIWTTNRDRSQEVFLLFFSYACLLFSVLQCKLRSGTRVALLLALAAVTVAVEGQALYQHFSGLSKLKAELMQHPAMDADFRSALLARVQSGRIFANFSLPNTLAGLMTMILPILSGLFLASLFPSKVLEPSARVIVILTHSWVRLALIAGIVLSIWVLAITQSFGGWVGLCCSVGAVFFRWLCQRKQGTDWIVGIGLLLVLAGSWLAWTSHKRGFGLWNLDAAENPIALRLISYKTAVEILKDFPITGVGLGNYGAHNPRYQTSPRLVTQFAHNTLLQLLAEGGLSFLGGFLLVGVVGIRRKWVRNQILKPVLSRDPVHLGMMGALVAWFVHNGLDIDLYFTSLGALGFLLVGLFLSHPGGNCEEPDINSSRFAKVPVFLVEIAVGLALLTAMRFHLSRSLLDLAGVSASSQNLAEANQYARWAVQIRPQDASGVFFLGKLETQRLKHEGEHTTELLLALRESLKEAVRLDPYNAEFHFELSRVYRGLGDERLADESRGMAIALFPSEPKYRKGQNE